MAEAASAAIAAGEALSVLADAERTGVLRARRALSTDVLRHVARAAKRTREADSEYEQAILLVLGGSGSHTARSPLPGRSRSGLSARSSPAPSATPQQRRPSPMPPHQLATPQRVQCRPDARHRPLVSL